MSLTRRLTICTSHWPHTHSPSASHVPVTIHHAPTATSPAAVVSRPYPCAWPGRGRPLPFRSYRDHAASLSARSRRALPLHRRADLHCSSEPPPSKSLTSTGSSSSSCAAILRSSHIAQRSSARPPRREPPPVPIRCHHHVPELHCNPAVLADHLTDAPYLPSAYRHQATPADRAPPWTAPLVSP
jgi:hypothetical protein